MIAGSYTFTVTNSVGCTSVASASATINAQPPTPSAPTSTGNIVQCEQSPIQILNADNAITQVTGTTYTWFDAPTAGNLVASPTLNTVGTVTYYVEANNGCISLTRTAVTLTINPAPAAPVSAGNITQCEQSPIQTITATASVPVAQTITWYDAPIGGLVVASPTLNTVGTVTYYAEANDGTCPSYTRTAVTLTINPAPAAPTSTGNITQCEQSPIQTITATASVPVAQTITWYDAPIGGLVVASPTLNTVGTVTYYAEANDGTCPSYARTAVTLTINSAPAAPVSGGNITQCEQSPIQTITATASVPASQTITWYDAPIGGLVVASPTLNTVGTVTYYAEANDGTCPSYTRTAVTLTIHPAPAAPVSAGNITQCEQSPIQTLTATASVPAAQTITWYDAPIGGLVVASPTLSTVGTVTYYAEANDGTCPSYARTAVTLTINPAPTAPVSAGNITQCEQSPIQTLTATASVPVAQTITWYDAPIGGLVVASPTLNTVGTVTYYAEANDGTCNSLTRTSLTLTINPAPAAPVSGGNITQCEQSPIQTITATASVPASQTITWYDAPIGGLVVASPTLNTVGTVTYYAETNDGTCPSYTRTAVTLTINPAPAAPTSTGNITQCEQSPIQTLDARNAITTVTGISYTWYDAPTAGLVVATPTLNTVGTVTYYVEANDGTCPSYARTAVTLTINPAPAAPVSGGNITQCEQSPIQTITATASVPVAQTITWYDAPIGGLVAASPTLNTVGTVTYYAEANDGTCPSYARTAVTLTINPAPAAPVSAGNITQCEQSPIQTLTATASVPVAQTITWYDAPIGGLVVASPTLNTVGTVTYYAEANDGTCPSYARTAVTLTINSAPAAPVSGGNITQCEQSPIQTITATASVPASQTITWYDAPIGGLVVASPTLNTVGTVTYYAEANDGTCPSYTRTAVTLTIHPAPAAPVSAGNITQCEQSPIQTLTATASVPAAQTITWYDAPIGGLVVASPTLSTVGTVTYYAEANDGTCPSYARTAVTLTINPAPTAPVSAGNITQCEQSPIQTLTATASVPVAQTITWYDAPIGGLVVASPTLNTVGTVTYYAEANDGTCNSLTRTSLTLTINPAPAAPVSGGNITQCEQSPIQTLTATASVPVAQTITWYDAPIGGLVVASPTLSTVGTVTYYAEANDGTCPSYTRTAVTLTINPAPAAPVSAGNITQCEQSPIQTITATASVPAAQTITWYDAPIGGLVVASPTLNTVGTVTYYAEANDGTCNSLTRTSLTLTINPAPAAPTSTGNITQCESFPIQTLDANNAIVSVPGINIVWYNLPTGGSIVSTPTLSVIGTITYYAEANDINCPSYTRTPVTLTIEPAPAAPISTGNITECEQLPIQTLDANDAITAVTGQTVIWYDAPVGGNIIASPTWSSLGSFICYGASYDGTCESNVRTQVTLTIIPAPGVPIFGNDTTECAQSPLQTLTAMAVVPPGQSVRWYDAPTGGNLVPNPSLNSIGTITYYGEAFNGTCASTTRLPVVLTINPSPAAPVSGGNITECEQSPIQTLTATASVPSGQTIVWYDAQTGGNVVSNAILNTPGSVTYYAEATDGICQSLTRTAVTLTIEPAPAAPISGGNITQCAQAPLQTITATASAGVGQSVSWFTSPTGGIAITNPTLNAIGTITFYAEASQGNCKSFTRTPVTLTIDPSPAPPITGGDITQCANNPIQTLTATATPANIGDVISWFDAPSGGNLITNPQLNTFGAVTYYAESSNGLCPSLTRTAVTLTLNAKPSAPTVIITQPDCTTSTGSFTVFPVAPGVTYSFDGSPFTGNTFYDLIPENSTHTLVAQNISNCTSATTTIVIQQQPTTPNAPVVLVTQPNCTVATGIIDITPIPGETYSFDNGPFVAVFNYPNLIDGSTHTIRAKNSAGCFSVLTTVQLDVQPTTPTAPILTATQPTCAISTGSISITGSIGETYSIDGGPFTSNLVYPNLAAGSTHNVRAQNAAGCISVASSFTLDPQPPTPGAPSYTMVPPTCSDDFGSVNIIQVPGELYSFDGGPFSATLNYPNLPSASTHTIVAQNSFNCESTATVININPQPITPLPILYDGVICVDELTGVPFKTYILDTQLNLATHTFVWYLDGNVLPDTGNAIQATQPGIYGVIATNINGCTSALVTAQITASTPGLSIDTEVSNQFSNQTSVLVTVNSGTGPFLYQIDFGPQQASNIFTSVNPGIHQVHVTDENGCTDITDEVLVLGYPNFFTPNGDGFNDTWNIVGLEKQPDTEIYIFDRHGKFIKQISSTTDGWDGTMNGQLLPATDYWFRVEYTDKGQRKEFKSHFSLVR
nr:T9SS type B sorting domain-containing protein [Flavobacterium sp. CYK-55]